MDALDFLRALYGPSGVAGAHLTLSWPNRAGDRPRYWSAHLSASDLPASASGIRELDAGGENVYFGLCLRKEDLGPYRRGKRADCLWFPGLWLDVDVAGPGHAAKHALPDLAGACAIVDAAGVEPTIVVDSGRGLHCYWLLAGGPVRVASKTERDEAEALCGALQARCAAEAQRLGVHLDVTRSIEHVLRVPGTTNRKSDRAGAPLPELPVRVVSSGGPRLPLAELSSILQPRGISPASVTAGGSPPAAAPPPPPGAAAGPGRSAPPADPMGPDEVRRKLSVFVAERHRQTAELILAGRPFAQPGARDSAMQSLAGLLAFSCPGASPETLLEVLRPSLLAMAREAEECGASAPTDEWALDKLHRASSRAADKRDEDARFRDDLVRAARAGMREPSSRSRSGPYDEDELEEYAASLGCTVRELKKRWIVQRDSAHFVFYDGRYVGPIAKEGLEVALPRLLALAPVPFTVETAAGGSRPKKVSEILRDHASPALSLVSDLTLPASAYDAERMAFREAVAPARADLAPAHDPQVDRWLRLLGGPLADKLLDWVASVTRLDLQCCALYVERTSGAGKSMLATGLARIWSSTPTEFASAVSGFNDALTRCPLVFADESTVGKNGRRVSTAEVRRLVGQSSRQLCRKFLPDSELIGAVRLILAANNDGLLAPGEEEMGSADFDAVAGRFLHIVAPPEAAAYLRSIGGRAGTADWVEGDRIARHALWLRDNRRVIPGSRFIVEGLPDKMHRKLLVGSKWSSLAQEWVVGYLLRPTPAIAQSRGVVVEGGRVRVSTAAVRDHWSTYVKSEALPPSTQRIGRAMASISSGGESEADKGERGTTRYWEVRVEALCDWAEDAGVASADAVRAAVERGLPALQSVPLIGELKNNR